MTTFRRFRVCIFGPAKSGRRTLASEIDRIYKSRPDVVLDTTTSISPRAECEINIAVVPEYDLLDEKARKLWFTQLQAEMVERDWNREDIDRVRSDRPHVVPKVVGADIVYVSYVDFHEYVREQPLPEDGAETLLAQEEDQRRLRVSKLCKAATLASGFQVFVVANESGLFRENRVEERREEAFVTCLDAVINAKSPPSEFKPHAIATYRFILYGLPLVALSFLLTFIRSREKGLAPWASYRYAVVFLIVCVVAWLISWIFAYLLRPRFMRVGKSKYRLISGRQTVTIDSDSQLGTVPAGWLSDLLDIAYLGVKLDRYKAVRGLQVPESERLRQYAGNDDKVDEQKWAHPEDLSHSFVGQSKFSFVSWINLKETFLALLAAVLTLVVFLFPLLIELWDRQHN